MFCIDGQGCQKVCMYNVFFFHYTKEKSSGFGGNESALYVVVYMQVEFRNIESNKAPIFFAILLLLHQQMHWSCAKKMFCIFSSGLWLILRMFFLLSIQREKILCHFDLHSCPVCVITQEGQHFPTHLATENNVYPRTVKSIFLILRARILPNLKQNHI